MMQVTDLFKICGPKEKTTSKSRGFSFVNSSPPEPSVYDEAMAMLSAALTIYIFADLRDLARGGAASFSLEESEAPLGAEKMIEMIKANKEALMASGSYDDLESRLRTLARLHGEQEKKGILDTVLGKNGGKEAQLVEFVDVDSQRCLVHGITINSELKRVTVTFRGSVTKNDFIADSKVVQIKVENPVHVLNEKCAETINIHAGFYGYLFRKDKKSNKTRIEEILDSVKDHLRQNPGFKLYCTGHSLGGALCTLFSFYAASDEDIIRLVTGPIRVYSIASPYVGNVKFLLAFQALERLKRLQHLRIANAEDVVTHMPFVAPKVGMLSPILALTTGAVNLYKHSGIKLHLNSTTPSYKLYYIQDQSTDDQYAKEIAAIFEDGKNLLKSLKLAIFNKDAATVVKYHSCEEYEVRLQVCKEYFESKTLNDLYSDKGIVGNVLDPNYEPKVMLTASERISRISGSPSLRETFKSGFGFSKKAEST